MLHFLNARDHLLFENQCCVGIGFLKARCPSIQKLHTTRSPITTTFGGRPLLDLTTLMRALHPLFQLFVVQFPVQREHRHSLLHGSVQLLCKFIKLAICNHLANQLQAMPWWENKNLMVL